MSESCVPLGSSAASRALVTWETAVMVSSTSSHSLLVCLQDFLRLRVHRGRTLSTIDTVVALANGPCARSLQIFCEITDSRLIPRVSDLDGFATVSKTDMQKSVLRRCTEEWGAVIGQ